MRYGLPGNTSGIARLLNHAPAYAVGWQDVVYLPAPAVGADWAYTVDGRYWERLLAAFFTFTTDAVVANRSIRVQLGDHNGTAICRVPGSTTMVASTSIATSLAVGIPQLVNTNSGSGYGAIPDVLAPSGWTWKSITGGIDPGDAYGPVTLLVQRYPNDITRVPVEQL